MAQLRDMPREMQMPSSMGASSTDLARRRLLRFLGQTIGGIAFALLCA